MSIRINHTPIYPWTIYAPRKFLDELYQCEYGRFEDAQEARSTEDDAAIADNGYDLVLCDFLPAHNTTPSVTVHNDDQLCELYFACASGTIGVNGYKREANQLLNQIRDAVRTVNPELVASWPIQEG